MAQNKTPLTFPIAASKAAKLAEALSTLPHVKVDTSGHKATIHDEQTGQVLFHAQLNVTIEPVNLPQDISEAEVVTRIKDHIEKLTA